MANKDGRIQKMLELAERGKTYTEIGTEMGISRQRVYQLIGGRRQHFVKVTKEECVYDGIREWLNVNKVSRAELTRRMYGYFHAAKYCVVSKVLKGAETHKRIIDKILLVTGLTYEQAFKRRKEDNSEISSM